MRRCIWCAVESFKTTEDSRNYQFVKERTRQQRCYRPEFDEALVEFQGTIVPPTSGVAASRSAPVRVKDNSSQSSAVLWSWHGRQHFQRNLSRICISRRKTIVREFGVQNPYYFVMCFIDKARKNISNIGYPWFFIFYDKNNDYYCMI